MLIDRQKIYRVLQKDGRTKSYTDENEFFQKYFINENSVLELYNFLKSHNHKVGNRAGQVYVDYDEATFFKKYVCGDLTWSKNSQYCNTNNVNNTNSGGGSSTPRTRGTKLNPQDYEGIDFKYKYPGDRNYRYGVKGTDWYAKNITNQKIFNITKDGFTSSVDKLNTQFPEAFKEVVQPVSPETKTPVTTQDSTKVVTNVPPVKPVDSTNTGTYVPPVKPMDSTNTGTKTPDKNPTTDEYDNLRDETTDEYDNLRDETTDEYDNLTNI
jgi:hypothetical protein